MLMIFGSIALAFFLLMVGGLLFGHDQDAGHDHAFDHGDPASVSIFSMKVISTFGTGFGAAGTIATYYGQSPLIASMFGVIFGSLLGGVMYAFMAVITRQQASSLIDTDTLVNQSGTVTVAIEKDSVGEVAVSHAGNYTTYSARAAGSKPIQKGRHVRVVRTSGSLLFVEEAGAPTGSAPAAPDQAANAKDRF
ncbi:MAG TPA: NfeD family protein [Planctomycetota bacterium]|nr:NfeD family protein [Planctomycetota bacterium]